MEILPFARHCVDLRISEADIGRVVPVADIAEALEIGEDKIKNIVDKDSELFKDYTTVVKTVMGTGKQKKAYGSEVALNLYGIISLLMELRFSGIVISCIVFRFLKWARANLEDSPGKKKRMNNPLLFIPDPANDKDFMKIDEAVEVLGRSRASVYRYIRAGKLRRYKSLFGNLLNREEVNRMAAFKKVSKN